MSDANNFVRWYDSRPKLSQAARLLFTFPDEIKSIISEAVLIIADREFRQDEKERHIRSLGYEKILALHKSKSRRREYDENQHLHQAMNYLYLLSEDNREFMAEHILKMVRYIQHYLETCMITQTAPSLDEIAEITTLYIKSGDESVKLFLKNLRHEFCEKLLDGKEPTINDPLLAMLDSIAKQDSSGMRLSKLD
ncbi:hypothetical protein [Vampirovibrio sp.]|uniref:hypothetical protein n=1 Tax=Vampirovibrio sp. TaxID=2717857 RepID=UPI00359453F6